MNDEPRIIATADAPAAIGPYSQAVVHGGLAWCSGQVAFDPATGELTGDDAAAQADRALRNLSAVLAAAGTSLARAVRMTVYLTDMADYAAVNAVYARWVPNKPARVAVAVAALPKGALVEIDCIAAL